MASTPFHSYVMDTGAQPGVTYAGMSPELQQEATAIARKKAMVSALIGQGMDPIQQQTTPQGRVVPIGIASMIAKVLQAGGGAAMMRREDANSKTLADRSKVEVADAMQAFNTRMSGSPTNEPTDGMGPTRPPVAPDPKGAIQEAMMSQQPTMMHMAEKAQAAEVAKAQHAADAAARTSDREYAIANRVGKGIPDDWKKHIPAGTKPGPTPGTFIGSDGDLMQLKFEDGKVVDSHNVNPMPKPDKGNQSGAVTTATIVDPKDNTKQLVVDARKFNKAKYLSGDDTGVVGHSGKEGDVQKREAKRQFAMQGIGATLTSARNILEGKGGAALPTGSGFGTAVDYAASLVGATPSGAPEADKMKVIGGALTSKMPRMEGPQSDKDTAMYKEMAGRVGDNTLPVERRLKALDEIENLWAKYEHQNPGTFEGSQTPGGGALTPTERARLEELRKKRGTK